MTDLISEINQISILWICALVGTGMFVLQFIASFFGIDAELDSGDMDGGSFKLLSKQTISAFLMFFGWAGLTCVKQFHLQGIVVLIISLSSGFISMVITSLIFQFAKKMHSPGSVFNIDEAIGKEAVVYQRIPKKGAGKITISLNQFTHEIDAVSEGEEIDSFTPVQVIKKINDKTVLVGTL